MLYTYRIERANGIEFVVQEHYRKRIFTQDDVENFQKFKDMYSALTTEDTYDIPKDVEDFFVKEIHDHGVFDLNEVKGVESLKSAFREFNQISVSETFPCCVVRGAVVDNKVVELYCSYVNSVLPGEAEADIHRFYNLFDSIHWRNTIAYQRDKQYGCLFGSEDFEESGSGE